MLAAEPDQTEPELPESICQPRHVRLFIPALNPVLSTRNALGKAVFPTAVKPGPWPGEAVLAG